MKRRLTTAAVGVGTLVASAGIALLGGVAAHAATAPPWEPDSSNSVGTISFFNSSGAAVTSGTITDSPFALYAVGSALPRAGDTSARLVFAQPDPTKANPINWTVGAISALATTFPVTAAGTPANISALSASHPVVKGSASDNTLQQDVFSLSNTGPAGDSFDGAIGCAYSATPSGCTNTAYQNLYQLRLQTFNGSSFTGNYDDADILVNPTTGAWTQVFPAVATSTTTTLGSSANPSVQGSSVTFTATETASDTTHPAGSVVFSVDGVSGSPVAVNASGVATTSTSALATGSHPVIATFTPTDTSDFTGSTSTTLSQVVNPPSTPTTTSLTLAGNTTTGGPATLSGSVTPTPATPVAVGSVEFFDNGSASPLAIDGGTSVAVSGTGTYSATITGGFAAGTHSVVAKFIPTDVTKFESSSSAANPFFTAAPAVGICAATGSSCTDQQSIEATIPTGTLVISTPYNGSVNALNLGTLALNSNGTAWTGNAAFQCIRVTDSSSGGNPFVASAIAGTLVQTPGSGPTTGVTSINGQDVGLTALAPSGASETCPDGAAAPVQSYTGTVTPTNNPAASPAAAAGDTVGTAGLGNAPHTVLTGSAGGEGTTTYDGTLTINAPTSTTAGLYTGTVTFTVTD